MAVDSFDPNVNVRCAVAMPFVFYSLLLLFVVMRFCVNFQAVLYANFRAFTEVRYSYHFPTFCLREMPDQIFVRPTYKSLLHVVV